MVGDFDSLSDKVFIPHPFSHMCAHFTTGFTVISLKPQTFVHTINTVQRIRHTSTVPAIAFHQLLKFFR